MKNQCKNICDEQNSQLLNQEVLCQVKLEPKVEGNVSDVGGGGVLPVNQCSLKGKRRKQPVSEDSMLSIHGLALSGIEEMETRRELLFDQAY